MVTGSSDLAGLNFGVDQGRNPDDCKVLFTLNPIVGEDPEEAEKRRQSRRAHVRDNIEERLANSAKIIDCWRRRQ